MPDDFIPLLEIEELPFFYGLLDKEEVKNTALPRFLPFAWGMDLRKGLFCQLANAEVVAANNRAYLSSATIAPPTGEGDFGKQWATTVAKILAEYLPPDISGQKILEIGCSNGLLLGELASMGATCVGIEPGPQAESCQQITGLRVHCCYFEQYEPMEKFDFIYAINLLEHIVDLDVFVARLRQVLKPGGYFVAAVPDSNLEMQALSPNLFVHEHYWYFTPETFARFLENNGFQEVKARKSAYGSNFFICARFADTANASCHGEDGEASGALLDTGKKFARELDQLLLNLQLRIDELGTHHEGCVGLYGASNAINFLGLLDWKVPVRVFDTDSYNHGKYLWDKKRRPIAVEAPLPDELRNLSEIWILPVAHQEAINNYLLDLKVPSKIIFTYSQLRAGQ